MCAAQCFATRSRTPQGRRSTSVVWRKLRADLHYSLRALQPINRIAQFANKHTRCAPFIWLCQTPYTICTPASTEIKQIHTHTHRTHCKMINNNRWLLIVVAKYTVRGLTLDRRLIDGFHTRRVYIYYVYVRVFLAAFILWVFFCGCCVI